MAKPVVLAVDDDREVLAAIERDLRRHFSDRYRILTASSGPDALEALNELRRRGGSVALLLVDQRMPGIGGVEATRLLTRRQPKLIVLLVSLRDPDPAPVAACGASA